MIRKFQQYAKNKRLFYLTSIALLIILTFYGFNLLGGMDNRLQDYVYQSSEFLFEIDRSIAADIIIVGIDEATVQQLGRLSDWPRDVYAKVINKMTEGKASVIGIDVLFTDTSDPESDQALVQAVGSAGNVVVPSFGKLVFQTFDGVYAEEINRPFNDLANVCIHAHINTIPDSDGVVRKTINQISSEKGIINSFGIEIYKQYVKAQGIPSKAENFRKYEDIKKSSYFDYAGGPGTFSTISFAEVLADDFPVEYFENAIVLIGPATEGMMDAYHTPVSKNQATYGVEIWANVIQNLINGTNKRKEPAIDLLAIIGISLSAAFLFKRNSPLKGAIILLLLNGGFLLISRWMYSRGIILSLIYIILGTMILYLSMLVMRYIEEYLERKRVTDVFGRYVAPQVVEKILRGGEEGLKLGGTRKLITALFVDIRGFTPMSEKATPEQVVEILNEYLNLCASAIVGEGGTLDKFIGDAAMAIFNAPLDQENHAFHAVKTALAMKQGSRVLEKKLEEKYKRAVKFGIGINTGYAVVGNIGCHFRMDYTAIGDTVNTAARLESNAKPGQILISDATYELIRDKVTVNTLGSIKVKGKEEEIKIYEVEGLSNGA
ncbi:MAG: adenylate/guanylate cyclase protein [Clostridia bacterium]|jgi:adenylate cyclase|nr:adenylate/guanylate cyclase protein [Clostridia bacterium]